VGKSSLLEEQNARHVAAARANGAQSLLRRPGTNGFSVPTPKDTPPARSNSSTSRQYQQKLGHQNQPGTIIPMIFHNRTTRRAT
jgi:hypothetical protein